LYRVVRQEDGSLAEGRTLPGRGAWLCRDSPGCIDQAKRRNAFGRALRGEVGGLQVDEFACGLIPKGNEGRTASGRAVL
jgi:predicted RNA-binding protein YlxR (DUF448 family)